MVVLAGLASRDHWPAIGSVFRTIKNAGPYMEGYVIEAMFKMGEINDALDRLRERYDLMVNGTNCTTLWEWFSDHIPGPHWPDVTKNHAWSGAPVSSLIRYIAGISPTKPGYNNYQVCPNLGALESVNAVVPSVKGNICVSISRDEKVFSLSLVSPDQTTAAVGIPKNALGDHPIHTIKAQNTIIWQDGYYVSGGSGIGWNGETEQFYSFNVEPGSYDFIALPDLSAVIPRNRSFGMVQATNFPNPFNDQTTIRIEAPIGQPFCVQIYDLNGSEVFEFSDHCSKEVETIVWDGNDSNKLPLPSGMYICQITLGLLKKNLKMILIR